MTNALPIRIHVSPKYPILRIEKHIRANPPTPLWIIASALAVVVIRFVVIVVATIPDRIQQGYLTIVQRIVWFVNLVAPSIRATIVPSVSVWGGGVVCGFRFIGWRDAGFCGCKDFFCFFCFTILIEPNASP